MLCECRTDVVFIALTMIPSANALHDHLCNHQVSEAKITGDTDDSGQSQAAKDMLAAVYRYYDRNADGKLVELSTRSAALTPLFAPLHLTYNRASARALQPVPPHGFNSGCNGPRACPGKGRVCVDGPCGVVVCWSVFGAARACARARAHRHIDARVTAPTHTHTGTSTHV